MSGGTLIALAADRIPMAPSAVLGPVDPQVGQFPATSATEDPAILRTVPPAVRGARCSRGPPPATA